MKINLLALPLFLTLATAVFAAMPGAIAPVTFGLTVTREGAWPQRNLANGNTETTYNVDRLVINNRTLLDEATRRGLLPANAASNKYKGWQIVAAYEESGILYEFFAFHPTSKVSVSLEPIVRLEYRPDLLGGSANTGWGKVTRSTTAIVAGTLTYSQTQFLTVILGDSTYLSSANATTTHRWLPALMGQGRSQWVEQVNGAYNVLGSGPETLEGGGRDPITGRIAFSAPKRILDMESLGMW